MTYNPNAPRFILIAVKRIYPMLPTLIGEPWPQIAPQVDRYLQALEQNAEDYRASTQLFGLLAGHESARQRLNVELTMQQIIADNVDAPLATMQLHADEPLLAAMLSVVSWDVDVAPAPSAEEATKALRSITLKEGGVDGGRSIKFKNLEIDITKMMTMGGGFMLAGQNMLDKLTPFMLAGGVLVMVGTLLSEMTVKIEQQETTVFWGMIQATGTMRGAGLREQTIFEVTNAERAKYGLDALTEQQVRASLVKLKQLNSIALSGDTYRIIEKFKVKG